MSVEKKMPEIRFKGFSGEWEVNTLGDYTTFRRGSFPQPYGNKEWYGGEGAMPFVQVVDVGKELSLVEDTKQKISLKAQLLSVFVPRGSVVVTLQGTIGRVAVTQYDSFFDRTILIFQSFSKSTDSYFWAYTIQNKFDFEKKRAPGGTIKTITKDALSSFDVLMPSTEEQTAIGNTFQKLDSLITQHQQKHDKLSNIKKAMLEKMFPKQGETTPEIRFKGFSGEWRTSQLSELALFNPKEELPMTFKYVDLESVKGTSLIGYRVELRENAPSRAQRLAKKGDVFFQTVRPYQKNNYLFNKVENDYVFSTGYAQLRPYYDGDFLLNLVQRDSFVKNVLDNCTGTSYPAINASKLAGLEVSYPETKYEQTKIGNYFQKLDSLINQHQQQISKLTHIKQAFLSKMFV